MSNCNLPGFLVASDNLRGEVSNMKPNSQCGPLGHKRSIVRWQTLKKAVLLLSAVALAATMLPTPASAQSIGSDRPSSIQPMATEYRYVEVYIEGQEPHTILSGQNLSLSDEGIEALVRGYLSNHGLMDSQLQASQGYITCDRRTRIWYATFPDDAVVGRAQAECFGNFRWVQLTGTLRIAQPWSPDRQVAWDQVSSSRNFERMVAAPKAVCSSLDAEMWRARNDVVVRFHSGQMRTLPLRETEWYLFDCDV